MARMLAVIDLDAADGPRELWRGTDVITAATVVRDHPDSLVLEQGDKGWTDAVLPRLV